MDNMKYSFNTDETSQNLSLHNMKYNFDTDEKSENLSLCFIYFIVSLFLEHTNYL